MILEGAMSGYTMLTVMDDNMVSPMSNIVIVTSTELEGVEVTPTTLTLSVTEDDMETTYTLTPEADSVMEGDEIEIDVMASQAVTEDTMIDLVLGAGSADADDYTAETVMIMAGSDTGGATLMATDDTLVEGDETLTLNGMIGNMVVGSVMVTITDNDMDDPPPPPTVTAMSQADVDAVFAAATGANWMVGGSATVDMSMLFDSESTTIVYVGGSSNEMAVTASSSGMMLSLSAEAAGVSTITVTATDTVSEDSASASSDLTVNTCRT